MVGFSVSVCVSAGNIPINLRHRCTLLKITAHFPRHCYSAEIFLKRQCPLFLQFSIIMLELCSTWSSVYGQLHCFVFSLLLNSLPAVKPHCIFWLLKLGLVFSCAAQCPSSQWHSCSAGDSGRHSSVHDLNRCLLVHNDSLSIEHWPVCMLDAFLFYSNVKMLC